MTDHTHISIGTILIHDYHCRPGDPIRRFVVTAETRLSWKVQELTGDGGIFSNVTTLDKATMIDRKADGRGYSRYPYLTLAAHERNVETARVRREVAALAATADLEQLRAALAVLKRPNADV